jgi:hypothetical protein
MWGLPKEIVNNGKRREGRLGGERGGGEGEERRDWKGERNREHGKGKGGENWQEMSGRWKVGTREEGGRGRRREHGGTIIDSTISSSLGTWRAIKAWFSSLSATGIF